MGTEQHYQDPIIHRRQKTCYETSPWDDIVFTKPVGSDALADMLKKAYPYPIGKNLKERKYLAVIDFLKAELEEMNDHETGHDSMDAGGVGSPSVASITSQDISSGSSQNSVSAHSSPSASPLSSSRLAERDQRHKDQKSKKRNSIQALPQQSMQTIVFNASDGRAMQLNTRRKMTLQEREGYKQTRKRGACDKCKKTKAKCTHGEGSQTEPKKSSKRRAPTPSPDSGGTKKIPKTETRVPLNIPLTPVPEIQQPRRPVPASPSSYQGTGISDGRNWAPGIAGQNPLYVPPLIQVSHDGDWISPFQPCMEPFPPEIQNPPGYFSPATYNVNPDPFTPHAYMSPTHPRENGQFPVDQ